MTLANQVDRLACRCIEYRGLAGEVIATVKMNHERGHIRGSTQSITDVLAGMIASWEKSLKRIEDDYPESP